MGYIQPSCRNQLTLPQSLEDYIHLDNPVRLIDAFIDKYISLYPDALGDKGTKSTGRDAYHFGTLSKLYVYGYLNSISSSRKLERETHRNMELIWLLGNLHPDHKTISDFRSSNKTSIHGVCVGFRRFLVDNGYISGKLVVTDGSKIKANASRDMLSISTINKRLASLESNLDKYLNQLTDNDKFESLEEQIENLSSNLNIEPALLQTIAELQHQIEQLSQQKDYLEKNDRDQIAPSDKEARLMKTKDGFLPAYNIQTVIDGQNHLIGSAIVTDHPNDYHDLENNVQTFKEDLGIVPQQVLADSGYANEGQIQSLEEESEVVVPFRQHKPTKEQQHANITFNYDSVNDCYICSQNKKLASKGKVIKRGKVYRKFQGKDCELCPLRELCTKSKKGRIIYKRLDDQWSKQYHQKLKSGAYKQLIKLRKNIVEHPFGTIKYWMGQIPLLLRGKEKVQVEIDLYATCYNIKRLMNMENSQNILQKIQKWG